MSPHKKIFRLRCNKSYDETIFLPAWYIFCIKILNNFPMFRFVLFPKYGIQMARSVHNRLISKVIPASFTQQKDATSWRGDFVFLPWCRDCIQSVPTTRSLIRRLKDCIEGPEAYPSCSITCMSLLLAMLACGSRLAASTGQDLGRNSGSQNIWRSLSALAEATWSATLLWGTAVWHQMRDCSHTTTCFNVIYLR
jgi:hypothetical protein